jgi:hypothetical protein
LAKLQKTGQIAARLRYAAPRHAGGVSGEEGAGVGKPSIDYGSLF